MTLWWIGDFVLLLVVAPIAVYLLNGVLSEARAIVPTVQGIAETARAGSKDLDAVPLLRFAANSEDIVDRHVSTLPMGPDVE